MYITVVQWTHTILSVSIKRQPMVRLSDLKDQMLLLLVTKKEIKKFVMVIKHILLKGRAGEIFEHGD